MTPGKIRMLQNAQERYLDHIKKIDVDNDIINKLQEEHVFLVKLLIKHMIKEKTIHRSDELISFHKRMTNLMYVLFSSHASVVSFVNSIDSSFVKVSDKENPDPPDGEGNCSIEQILNELESFEF